MTVAWAGPRGRRPALVVAAIAAVLALAPVSPASAHAALVSTSPEEGAVLATAPEEVVLTFSEPVVAVPDGVTVFAASGEEVSSSAQVRDVDLVVTLDGDGDGDGDGDVGDGTLVVAWRVVSADGHPIAGSLTFSVGAPSEVVTNVGREGVATDDVPILLSLVRWVGYVGLLLAVGLVWFGALLVRPLGAVPARVRVVAGVSAVVASVAWVVGLPLTGAYQRGVGLGEALDSATWRTLPGEEYLLVILVAAGALNAVVIRDVTAAGIGLVAVVAPALTGHTRAAPPLALTGAADMLHLVAGALWFGGLVGLVLTLPTLGGPTAAALLSRFSTLAAAVLVALVGTGAVLAWRIVGSWEGLVSTVYGQLLLVKIGVAAVAVALAAVNRYVLLRRVRGGASPRLVARTVAIEALVLVGVLAVTGFLVNKSPERPTATSGADTARPVVASASLGDLVAHATLQPGSVGRNRLTVQLRDADGESAEGVEPPRISVSSTDVDLGTVPMTARAAGTYEGVVVLPQPGTWEVQVSLRIDEFDNPVGLLTLDVR